MSISRDGGAKLHVYQNTDDLLAASTGDLTRVYIVKGGVYLNFADYNSKYNIEIFEDANGAYHGLFVKI